MSSIADTHPTGWTESLRADFGAQRLEREGGQRTLISRVAVGVDTVITAGLSLPYLFKIKPHLSDEFLREYLEYHSFYSEPRFLDDPGSFYVDPPETIEVHERPTKRYRWDPTSATRVMIEFYSPFETVNPMFREEYASLSPNERVESRAWFHQDGPRPVIIFLHGFSAPDYAVNTAWFAARDIYEAGMDVVLLNLPLHGARTPHDSNYHGTALLHPSMWRMTEACAQGILDLRVLVRYLKQRGAPMVGVNGYSWGAQHAALLAGIEPNLDFAIPISPVVSVADLLMTWPIRGPFRSSLREPDVLLRELRRMLAVTSPLSHSRKIDRDKIFLVAGRADRIAPATHTEQLWNHFDRPRVHWSEGGHVLYFDRKAVARRVIEFLRDASIL